MYVSHLKIHVTVTRRANAKVRLTLNFYVLKSDLRLCLSTCSIRIEKAPPPGRQLRLFWQKKHQVLFSDETLHA